MLDIINNIPWRELWNLYKIYNGMYPKHLPMVITLEDLSNWDSLNTLPSGPILKLCLNRYPWLRPRVPSPFFWTDPNFPGVVKQSDSKLYLQLFSKGEDVVWRDTVGWFTHF